MSSHLDCLNVLKNNKKYFEVDHFFLQEVSDRPLLTCKEYSIILHDSDNNDSNIRFHSQTIHLWDFSHFYWNGTVNTHRIKIWIKPLGERIRIRFRTTLIDYSPRKSTQRVEPTNWKNTRIIYKKQSTLWLGCLTWNWGFWDLIFILVYWQVDNLQKD